MFAPNCYSIEESESSESTEEASQEQEEDVEDEECDVKNKERDHLCEAFTLLDADGDGIITPRTMETVIVALGREPIQENLDEIMAFCSECEGKCMNFDGFCRYLERQLVDTDDEQKLREAFDVFGTVSRMDDPVPTGSTDLAELRCYLKHRGLKLTDEEIDYLWKEEDYWKLHEKRIDTNYLVKRVMDTDI